MDRIGRFALWLWRGGLNEVTAWAAGLVAFGAPVLAFGGNHGPRPLQWIGAAIMLTLAVVIVGWIVASVAVLLRGLYDWVRIAWHRSAP